MATTTSKRTLPSDPAKWAREMGLKGEFVTPKVSETTPTQGAPYACTAEIPAVDPSWPIFFGYPHADPNNPLKNIAGVDVIYLCTLDKEGVAVYVRAGEYE